MAKVLSAYRAFTAAQIKSRADVPNQADMTVVGTTVECVAITTTKIRNILASGLNLVKGNSIVLMSMSGQVLGLQLGLLFQDSP